MKGSGVVTAVHFTAVHLTLIGQHAWGLLPSWVISEKVTSSSETITIPAIKTENRGLGAFLPPCSFIVPPPPEGRGSAHGGGQVGGTLVPSVYHQWPLSCFDHGSRGSASLPLQGHLLQNVPLSHRELLAKAV